MSFQFTHPMWLWLLPPALAWVVWLVRHSDVQTAAWRRWLSFTLRVIMVLLLTLAVAGLQWRKPQEGMNVFFLLDRSDSIPSSQQEAARELVTQLSALKKKQDNVGVVVFGSEASIESSPLAVVRSDVKIYAVVDGQRTDLSAALRLGSAAFPETGQKRLVVLSDGNENVGDAFAAAVQARSMHVSIDAVPLGVARAGDVAVQKLGLPATLKEGQTFEVKIFVQADRPQPATVRLFLNDQMLGAQSVQLEAGKNLFTFPQTLADPGFYAYEVRVEAIGDSIPQNNRALNFVTVRGKPRVLLVSSEPDKDAPLAEALRSSNLEVRLVGMEKFPSTLPEMQSYESIFLSNIAAGDLGTDLMRLLESAVRDFGVGLVCVGGDQAFAAGGYRGTPLDTVLPVDMELSSKKVLPPGAVALIMHGMEFNNGNQVARQCAIGVLEALGPQDELGVLLWDGSERWLFDLQKVGDKSALRRQIQGMNQGDLPTFQGLMSMARESLAASKASLKHIIVFSDGDPGKPSDELLADILTAKITVSTIMISGHVGPEIMEEIASKGRGRFYNVTSADKLPQLFIKEAAVVLKSAIHEEPFRPQVVAPSELLRGIGSGDYPSLRGYVATTQKPRAETPLLTDKGDPLLAHWQYGLGRAAAFTSDARAKWGTDWLSWARYRQFWSQVANWSLRKLENADLNADITVERGEGVVAVEALDAQGGFRNFLNLQAVAVGPKGDRQVVRLDQTGPGHYEARFPTRDVGSYILNLSEVVNGEPRGSLRVGTSVNYSPEFQAGEPNHPLLRRIADASQGRVIDPALPGDNPFLHDREETFQPRDLWEWLLKIAILLFPLDVAARRVDIDRAEWAKAWRKVRRWIFFWQAPPRAPEADESLAALLARRDKVRAGRPMSAPTVPAAELFQPRQPVDPSAAPLSGAEVAPAAPAATAAAPEPAKEASAKAGAGSTASRLLEAKKRAQQRRK